MQNDPVFLLAGAAALLGAVYGGLKGARSGQHHQLLPALLWLTLGAGLLIQGLAPHLRIEHGAFVVPEKSASGARISDPIGVVELERRMQLLAAVLSFISLPGLCFVYRDRLAPQRRRAVGSHDPERRAIQRT